MAIGCAAGTADARDEQGRYVWLGLENDSCVGYLKARELARSGDHAKLNPYVNWVGGYLTAYNVITPNTVDITAGKDMRELLYDLDIYCKVVAPEATFVTATIELTKRLESNRLHMQQ
jgi:hypothetical protein